MKSLQESLLDDEDILLQDTDDIVKIKSFLNNNYFCTQPFDIIKQENNYIVNATGNITVLKSEIHKIKELTNGLFKFGKVISFDCSKCDKLRTLEGAPVECEYFYCDGCTSLITLKGAPQKCKDFDCSKCDKLRTLEGAPEKIEWDFVCRGCTSLKTLKGGPKYVKGEYNITLCTNLVSLEGIALEIKDGLRAKSCYKLKTLKHLKNTEIWGIINFSGSPINYEEVSLNLKNTNPNIFTDN